MFDFRRTTFNATQRVGPDRSASWFDTVDQGCAAQIREVATCRAQSVSRSRSKSRSQVQRGRSTDSEGKSRGKTTRTSGRCCNIEGRRAAQVSPMGVQLVQCEQFVNRACPSWKKVSGCESKDANPAAPVPPPDWAAPTIAVSWIQGI